MPNAIDTYQQLSYLLLTAYLVPLFASASMALALRLSKAKGKAHLMLTLVLLSLTGTVLLYTLKLFFLHTPAVHPVMQLFNQLYALATTPLIYFYFVALLRPGRLSLRMAARHFAPLAAWCAATLLLYLLGSPPQPYYNLADMVREAALPANAVRLGIVLTLLTMRVGYLAAIFVMLRCYRRRIKAQFSYTEGVNLRWAYWALLAMLLYSCAPTAMSAMQRMHPAVLLAFALVSTSYAAILFFAGLNQPALYADEDGEGYAGERRTGSLQGYSRERLKGELLPAMEQKKLYRSPTLSIDDVAKELGTNRTYVSKVINEELGASFYSFVNRYRLAEFMQLLHGSREGAFFKIKEASEQVGFKSYTSFLNHFREEMGTTPSEYLRQIYPGNVNE